MFPAKPGIIHLHFNPPSPMLLAPMLRPTSYVFWLGLVVIATLSSCKKLDKINVVIVTVDTTRADHIECYGHPKSKTPAINALAEDGVLFENAFTPVPITCPSHSTMMTGKVPFTHGIRDNGLFILAEEQETLAEILKKEGYACGAAIGAFPLLSRFGVDQGFDFYDERLGGEFEDPEGNRVIRKKRLFFDERKAALVNESIFPWLDEHKDEPFFAWLHYFDPHHPHEPPPPYNHRFADDLYLGEIAYSDECIGVLVDKLKEMGVYDNTMIVFLSDHGEGRGQHNEYTHSLLAYNSTLHVPLVIKNPGGAKGQRISKRVGTVDLLPTILKRIGIEPADDLQGVSLVDCLNPGFKESEPQTLYAETLSPRLTHGLGEIRAFYDGEYKYLHGPRKELFNIAEDPDELNNLIETEPEVASRMRSRLEEYLKDNSSSHSSQQVSIDEETARRLMALGYLGSSGAVEVGEERLRDDGVAPQERVIDNTLLSRAKHWLNLRQPTKAREAIVDLLERAPDNPAYLSLLAECERMSGNSEEALKAFEKLLETENAQAVIHPDKTLLLMSNLNLQLGNVEKAVEMIQEAQDFNETAQGHYQLAAILKTKGDTAGYFEELKKAVEFEDCPTTALIELGILYAQQDQIAKAETLLRKALEAEPYSARIHYNLAAFYFQQENLDEAIRLANRAAELSPGYILAHYLRFQLYQKVGDQEQAKAALSDAEKVAPAHPLVRAMKGLIR